MVRFAKTIALFGAAWTLCCAGLVLGQQLVAAEPVDLSVRSVLAQLTDRVPVYSTASETPSTRDLLDFVFGLHVLVPLLAAAALQLAFYVWLRNSRALSR